MGAVLPFMEAVTVFMEAVLPAMDAQLPFMGAVLPLTEAMAVLLAVSLRAALHCISSCLFCPFDSSVCVCCHLRMRRRHYCVGAQAKFLESERREITKARDILQVRPLCANRRDFKHSTRARAAVLYVRKVCGIRRVWAVREELPEREEGAPRHAPAAARAVLRGVEGGSRRSWEPWMDSLLPDPA